MNNIMIGAYVIVLGIFAYMFFIKKTGKPVEIILYKWVNKKRIFYGACKGAITKRYNESLSESLMINYKGKLWTSVPDSVFFLTNTKGVYTLQAIVDTSDNISFIRPNDTIYKKKVIKVKEPILDKDGKEQYEEVYIKDIDGELILENVIDDKGNVVIDKETKLPLMKPKIDKILLTKIVNKEIEEPSPYDQVIESDIKLYFLNKKEEIREKYKKEEKKSIWQTLAPIAMIGVIVLATVYLSYKHIRETMMEEAESRKNFFVKLSETIRDDPSSLNIVDNNKEPPERIDDPPP